jgi:ferrous iron transport protein B
MSDEAQAKGIDINENKLGALIGVPFVKISAHKSEGLDHLLDRVDEFVKERERIEEASLNDVQNADNTLAHVDSSLRKLMYSDKIEEKINELSLLLAPDIGRGSGSLSKAEKRGRGGERYLAIKLLEKDRLTEEFIGTLPEQEKIKKTTKQAIADIEKYCGKDSEIVISEQRYVYLRGIIKESVLCRKKQRFSLTESIDNGIMNRFLALPIFLAVLWCIFQLTFTIGAYPQSWLESLFGLASHAAENALEGSPLLQSLVVDGIIGGVGSVFSFVPLIVILFFFLSILEDLGYMSRAAFATDKLLNMFGLHGQSIFPMTLGFGCSVPAILASRTLKSRRDRILTVLVTPMMSCGAKLPIHVLFAGVFFGKNAPNIIILVYLCGIILALLSSLILKHTILRGAPTPFVLELPPYRMPTTRGVLSHVWEKFFLYFKKAGTVILASSILIWCITSFPRFNATEADTNAWTADYYKQAQRPGTDTEKNDEDSLSEYLLVREAEASLEYSAAGRIGYAIEPLFRPLGFNWKMSVATLTSFAAKEVVVSTLGIVYQIGNQEEEGSIGLREALAADTTLGTPEKAPLAAFSFMLFMLIIPPCFAALATIRSELGGKWLAFEWVYLFLLGWVVSFIVFQLGMAL